MRRLAQAPNSEEACQCIYMFFMTQSKKSDLSEDLIVFLSTKFYTIFTHDILEGCENFKEIQ